MPGSPGGAAQGSRKRKAGQQRVSSDHGVHTPIDSDRKLIEELREIPQVASKYDIIDVLGSGTFSVVFKAKRLDNRSRVGGRQSAGRGKGKGKGKKEPSKGKAHYRALKRIVHSCDPDRTEKEIHCLQLLHKRKKHPHIVHVRGAGAYRRKP